MRHGPWFLLFVLTLVGTINWADRQVVPILFPGIRAELGLTDTQLGMIGGLAFSMIYAASAFVFGRAADRGIRRNVVAVGLVLWSAATAAGAFATGFASLFAARFFTGLGEDATSWLAVLYPAVVAEMPGAPFDARITANQLILHATTAASTTYDSPDRPWTDEAERPAREELQALVGTDRQFLYLDPYNNNGDGSWIEVVGDLHTVLPAVTEQVNQRKG